MYAILMSGDLAHRTVSSSRKCQIHICWINDTKIQVTCLQAQTSNQTLRKPLNLRILTRMGHKLNDEWAADILQQGLQNCTQLLKILFSLGPPVPMSSWGAGLHPTFDGAEVTPRLGLPWKRAADSLTSGFSLFFFSCTFLVRLKLSVLPYLGDAMFHSSHLAGLFWAGSHRSIYNLLEVLVPFGA